MGKGLKCVIFYLLECHEVLLISKNTNLHTQVENINITTWALSHREGRLKKQGENAKNHDPMKLTLASFMSTQDSPPSLKSNLILFHTRIF